MPPDEFENAIARAIEAHIDPVAWNAEVERAKEERGEARQLMADLLRRLEGGEG